MSCFRFDFGKDFPQVSLDFRNDSQCVTEKYNFGGRLVGVICLKTRACIKRKIINIFSEPKPQV